MTSRSCSILLRIYRSVSRSALIHPTLIQKSTFFSTFPPDDLKRLDHKDWLSPREVLKIFDGLRNPESVMPVLDSVSKRKDFKPNEALYTLVINKLAQARMFDAIEDVIKTLKIDKQCRLSDVFFYNVIKVYGNVAGQPDRAVETLFDMPKFHCWPSVKTFNLVLNMLVSAKRFDVVHKVSGNVDAACELLDEYPKQRCRPNVRTFSTLMHGLCESGRVEGALGLLERMEREGVYPDTVVFNILISGLRKRGRVEEGMELLGRMKLKGCYRMRGLIRRFCMVFLILGGLENLVADVVWILKQMVEQGFVPERWMWRRILQTMFPRNVSHCCSLVFLVGNEIFIKKLASGHPHSSKFSCPAWHMHLMKWTIHLKQKHPNANVTFKDILLEASCSFSLNIFHCSICTGMGNRVEATKLLIEIWFMFLTRIPDLKGRRAGP
ncbi:Pentatricopeptide repeat-containing protein, mitochondrial [Vitis vinifera]|uniref:Pentatricopeptide repeat-containing protein, mitochondrial n=1 Tax=Vitis vinifera TaxID=29760 RepID=A0A438HK81_VITVI|nr:Pentatricopeptide repeat-containing protein, mitochondrial [Vitis vinifera]